MENITTPLGGIIVIDKVEKDFGMISSMFGGVLSTEDIGRMKVLLNNKMTYATSVRQIPNIISSDVCALLGATSVSERSLGRAVVKVGHAAPIIMERYQDLIKKKNLVDKNQNIDWSSSFFEGRKAEIAEYGYSRDHRPDKKQITWGISTGINEVPSALTIQNGNVQDKKHFNETYRLVSRISENGALFIFDCGANTKDNKGKIVADGFNYLTLKPKNLNVYKKYISKFKTGEKIQFKIDNRKYTAVKIKEGGEFQYIYFCKQLLEDQLYKKQKKFERQMKKGNELAKKVAKKKIVDRYPSEKGWVELYPELQRTMDVIENPYIIGIEGFFILESSVDASPVEILNIYKQRDVAEKLIRNLKEGIELRPIRHWTKYAIIGAIVIAFLAEAMINMTQVFCQNPLVKNVKLLKKFMMNLTLTFVYPAGRFKFQVVSNVSEPILVLFGDFWQKYQTKDIELRW